MYYVSSSQISIPNNNNCWFLSTSYHNDANHNFYISVYDKIVYIGILFFKYSTKYLRL